LKFSSIGAFDMKITVSIFAATTLSVLSFAMTAAAEPNMGLYKPWGMNPSLHHASPLTYKVAPECEPVPSVNNVGLGRHTTNLGRATAVAEWCAIPTLGALRSYGPYAPVLFEFAGEASNSVGG
jgi:hypothetical protein